MWSPGGVLAKAPEVLIALLMLTVPLEFTELWFPSSLIQVGRIVMVVMIVTLLASAVWAGQAVHLPPWSLWVPPAVFILYALISALVTRSGAGLKTGGAALTYALVAVAIYNWTRTRRMHDQAWLWFAISCLGLSLVAIVQRITGGYIWREPTAGLARINATFADPNVFGRVLTFMVVAGVALAPVVVGRRTRAVMLAGVGLSAAVLPFTYSREAWVFGGVTLVLAVITSHRKREALSIAAAAVAVFVAVTLFVPQVQSRFGELQGNLTGPLSHYFERPGLAFLNYLPLDSERHYLIAAGLQMFYDHPIFGLGFGSFPSEIVGPYKDFILPGYITYDSHTAVVTILAELGLVGFALWAWWLVEYFRRSVVSIRRKPSVRAYVLAPLLAIIVIVLGSQLQSRFVDEPYLWVLLGLAWSAMALPDAVEARASQPSATTTSAATSQNSTARSFFQ